MEYSLWGIAEILLEDEKEIEISPKEPLYHLLLFTMPIVYRILAYNPNDPLKKYKSSDAFWQVDCLKTLMDDLHNCFMEKKQIKIEPFIRKHVGGAFERADALLEDILSAVEEGELQRIRD